MENSAWVRVDRVMRWLHLYTGLFLVPWMLIYAASAFCLNHRQWVTQRFNITPPQWRLVQEVDFEPDDSFPHEPAEQARAILQRLDLDGLHRILGQPHSSPMVIIRVCGSGNYRVTWRRHASKIKVEKQGPFSYYRLVHFLHFRGGYGAAYPAHIIWAVIVDVVSASMLIWVVSGIYLWWRRTRKLRFGCICLAGGLVLFICLVIALCR